MRPRCGARRRRSIHDLGVAPLAVGPRAIDGSIGRRHVPAARLLRRPELRDSRSAIQSRRAGRLRVSRPRADCARRRCASCCDWAALIAAARSRQQPAAEVPWPQDLDSAGRRGGLPARGRLSSSAHGLAGELARMRGRRRRRRRARSMRRARRGHAGGGAVGRACAAARRCGPSSRAGPRSTRPAGGAAPTPARRSARTSRGWSAAVALGAAAYRLRRGPSPRSTAAARLAWPRALVSLVRTQARQACVSPQSRHLRSRRHALSERAVRAQRICGGRRRAIGTRAGCPARPRVLISGRAPGAGRRGTGTAGAVRVAGCPTSRSSVARRRSSRAHRAGAALLSVCDSGARGGCARGWRPGILTNGPPAVQRARSAALGLAPLVDAVVSRRRRTAPARESPTPRRLLEALRALGVGRRTRCSSATTVVRRARGAGASGHADHSRAAWAACAVASDAPARAGRRSDDARRIVPAAAGGSCHESAPRCRLALRRRRVGGGAPLFVIAEIGLNHGGSVDAALALVDAAAAAGAERHQAADDARASAWSRPVVRRRPRGPPLAADFFRRSSWTRPHTSRRGARPRARAGGDDDAVRRWTRGRTCWSASASTPSRSRAATSPTPLIAAGARHRQAARHVHRHGHARRKSARASGVRPRRGRATAWRSCTACRRIRCRAGHENLRAIATLARDVRRAGRPLRPRATRRRGHWRGRARRRALRTASGPRRRPTSRPGGVEHAGRAGAAIAAARDARGARSAMAGDCLAGRSRNRLGEPPRSLCAAPAGAGHVLAESDLVALRPAPACRRRSWPRDRRSACCAALDAAGVDSRRRSNSSVAARKPVPDAVNVLITAASRRVPLVQAFQAALDALGAPASVIVHRRQPLSPAVHVADRAYRVPLSHATGYLDAVRADLRLERIRLVVPTIDDELRAFRRRPRAASSSAGVPSRVSAATTAQHVQ